MKTETQTYKPLTAGDLRREGDEYKPKKGWGYKEEWKPVNPGMFGETILLADLIMNEYRRPV